MIIRCERCSTLYELDEGLLAPDGSQVQCARCQAIFIARPPRPAATPPPEVAAPPPAVPVVTAPAPERQASPVEEPPRAQAAAPPPPAEPSAEPQARVARELAQPAAAEPASERPPRPAPQRPARPGPAVYRAQQPSAKPVRSGVRSALRPGPQPGPRPPIALIAFGVLVALLLATGAWSLWRRKPDPEVGRLTTEAAARLALDDSTSIARAVQLYDDLLAKAPAQAEAEVERAVARLLMAAGQQEEAEPFADRLAAIGVDQAQLDRERPPGSGETLRALAAEAVRLEAELAPRRQAAEVLLAQAGVELRTVATGGERDALAARGLVLQAALAGDRAEVERLVPVARGAGPSPWPALAQAWIELRASGSREIAMTRLADLVKARPELLRARYLLARAQAASGRHEEALSTLAGLLAANPRHERALRLQGLLVSQPGTRATPGPESGAPASGPAQPAEAAPATAPAASVPTSSPQAAPPPPPPAAAPHAASPRPAAGLAPSPQPQSIPPRAAAPSPQGPGASAPSKGAGAPAPPAVADPGVDGAASILLPAPTRIEVVRPAVKAANIDAGPVHPLPPEPPAAQPPAKP